MSLQYRKCLGIAHGIIVHVLVQLHGIIVHVLVQLHGIIVHVLVQLHGSIVHVQVESRAYKPWIGNSLLTLQSYSERSQNVGFHHLSIVQTRPVSQNMYWYRTRYHSTCIGISEQNRYFILGRIQSTQSQYNIYTFVTFGICYTAIIRMLVLHVLVQHTVSQYMYWYSTQYHSTCIGITRGIIVHLLVYHMVSQYMYWYNTRYHCTCMCITRGIIVHVLVYHAEL